MQWQRQKWFHWLDIDHDNDVDDDNNDNDLNKKLLKYEKSLTQMQKKNCLIRLQELNVLL